MTGARLRGEWLRLRGALKECLGRYAGDDALRLHGERDRWMGRMEISCAIVRRTRVPEPWCAGAGATVRTERGARPVAALKTLPSAVRLRRVV
jgi:uncharacterized protein YjbJ (UPF0337 family)